MEHCQIVSLRTLAPLREAPVVARTSELPMGADEVAHER